MGASFVEICEMQIPLTKSKGVFGMQQGLSVFVFTASQSTGPVYWFLADPCAAPVVGNSLHYWYHSVNDVCGSLYVVTLQDLIINCFNIHLDWLTFASFPSFFLCISGLMFEIVFLAYVYTYILVWSAGDKFFEIFVSMDLLLTFADYQKKKKERKIDSLKVES